jgi:hypothetical protein
MAQNLSCERIFNLDTVWDGFYRAGLGVCPEGNRLCASFDDYRVLDRIVRQTAKGIFDAVCQGQIDGRKLCLHVVPLPWWNEISQSH